MITTRPVLNIKAVDLGSLIRIITALKRDGLYSTLRHLYAKFLRSILQFKLQVATVFYKVGALRCYVAGLDYRLYSANCCCCRSGTSSVEWKGLSLFNSTFICVVLVSMSAAYFGWLTLYTRNFGS